MTNTRNPAYREAMAQLGEQRELAGLPRYEAAHCVGCGAWLLAGHGPRCWVGALETGPAELADGPDEGDVIPGTEYAPGGIYDDQPAESVSCERCGGPLVAGEGDGNECGSCTDQAGTTPVADALQEVDQAGTEYGVPAAELLALRKLAAAVRSHGIGAELGRLREDRATVTEAQLAAAFLAARGQGKCLDDDVLRAIILAARAGQASLSGRTGITPL